MAPAGRSCCHPATLLGLTTQQLEAVLAHELAHIRRYDYLVNLLQMAVETLLFYHPAVWWTSSRIRHERELCCDDLAVASCGDALCYARALTRLERLRIATPAMALGSTGGPLAYRIQRLIGAGTRGYGYSKLPGLLALIAGLACFGLNIHWAHGQEKPVQSVGQEQPGRRKADSGKEIDRRSSRAREARGRRDRRKLYVRAAIPPTASRSIPPALRSCTAPASSIRTPRWKSASKGPWLWRPRSTRPATWMMPASSAGRPSSARPRFSPCCNGTSSPTPPAPRASSRSTSSYPPLPGTRSL